MELLTDTKSKFNISENMESEICKVLELIKMPKQYRYSISSIRNLKGIQALLILLYCVDVFYLVDSKVYNQLKMLSSITRRVYAPTMDRASLPQLRQDLEDFCEKCDEYFTKRFMIPNLAVFRLLVDDIERFGPCPTHTGFGFENMNQKCKKSIKAISNFETKAMDNWNNRTFAFFYLHSPLFI